MSHRFTSFTLAGVLGALVLASTSNPSFAHSTDGYSIGDRLHRQRHRIGQGIEQEQIGPNERRALVHEQLRTRELRYRMRHDDGHLGPKERARLQHRLNRSSHHIYRARHN